MKIQIIMFNFFGNFKLVFFLFLIILFIYIVEKYNDDNANFRKFNLLKEKYNKLINLQILIKLNKVKKMAKLNSQIFYSIKKFEEDYLNISKKKKKINELLIKIEDEISLNEKKKVDKTINKFKNYINIVSKKIYKLNNKIDIILKKETKERFEITNNKKKFLKLKQKALEQTGILKDIFNGLEKRISKIQKLFSAFENEMNKSNFLKANKLNKIIEKKISLLEKDFNKAPYLIKIVNEKIPSLFNELFLLIKNCKKKKIYLEHLKIFNNIKYIKEKFINNKIYYKNWKFLISEKNFDSIIEKIIKLKYSINNEIKAHYKLKNNKILIFENLDKIFKVLLNLNKEKKKIQERYDFYNFDKKIDFLKIKIFDIIKNKKKFFSMLKKRNIAETKKLIFYKKIIFDINYFTEKFNYLYNKIEKSKNDEIRANKQFIKLHLIINNIKIRIKRRNISRILDLYKKDFLKSYNYINKIKIFLEKKKLDINLLNINVEKAINFVYKLYNNINNLIGVIDMCEKSFIFANKYRIYFNDIDEKLTHAEFAFNNGDYSQSLSIIVNIFSNYNNIKL